MLNPIHPKAAGKNSLGEMVSLVSFVSFNQASPAERVGQIVGSDAMKAAYPFLLNRLS